jgi:hypothetical protein
MQNAQELVEDMARFPNGESEDIHDAACGLLRMGRGGFRIATDEEDEEYIPAPVRVMLSTRRCGTIWDGFSLAMFPYCSPAVMNAADLPRVHRTRMANRQP